MEATATNKGGAGKVIKTILIMGAAVAVGFGIVEGVKFLKSKIKKG